MIQKSIIFLLLFILTNNHVNSLHVESINGGYSAQAGTFKYQVTLKFFVIPTENETEMACTGALVHNSYAVAVAHCVINRSLHQSKGTFIQRWYKLAVGTYDLSTSDGLLVSVEEIFVPAQYNPQTSEADLSLIKLANPLDFNGTPQLAVLELPDENTIDEDVDAVASGYGFNWLSPIGIGYTDLKLHYVKMHTTTREECIPSTAQSRDSLLCVKTVPEFEWQKWGVCVGDSGAPVVVNKKLVGVVYRGRRGCVDTVLPSSATRIKSYTGFIRSVLGGTPPPDTHRFTNPFAPKSAPSVTVNA